MILLERVQSLLEGIEADVNRLMCDAIDTKHFLYGVFPCPRFTCCPHDYPSKHRCCNTLRMRTVGNLRS